MGLFFRNFFLRKQQEYTYQYNYSVGIGEIARICQPGRLQKHNNTRINTCHTAEGDTNDARQLTT